MKYINAKDLVAYALEAVGSGYVYGSSGQRCTLALRESCAAANPSQKENILGTSARWDGKYVWDCSGILRGAWRALWQYRSGGATTIFNTWCAEKGDIATMPDIPGILVFRGTDKTKAHVGVYVGNGMVVDARGSREGVLLGTKDSYAAGWSHWAMADEVDYENSLPTPEDIPALWTGHVRTRTGKGISIWADNAKSAALAKIPENAQVDILGEPDSLGFAQVRYNKVIGLSDLQYVIPEDGEEPAQESYAASVVGVSIGLNLRTSPQMTTNTLLLIPPGRIVEVFPGMKSGSFAYVRYEGKAGYCTAAKLLRLGDETAG